MVTKVFRFPNEYIAYITLDNGTELRFSITYNKPSIRLETWGGKRFHCFHIGYNFGITTANKFGINII